jgi:serine/threonine-protein kinase RsbW
MDPLRVPARLEALATIREYVRRAADAGGIGKSAAYRLQLAVDEVAANIVVHGSGAGQADEIILVNAIIDDDAVRIVLEDTGPQFNPLDKQDPVGLNRPAEERQVGGLGVFLAIRSVDSFAYDRVGDINRNTLLMRRHAATAGAR